MGKGSSVPSSDPAIGQAALMQAQTGSDALDWYKSQAEITNQWAAEDRSRYQNTFQPLQDAYIDKTSNWDSGARLKQVASEAKADVMTNAAQARQQSNRQLSAMGVNPNSGKFSGTTRALNLSTGLAAAGAQNNARSQARNEALSLQSSAINMGNGLAVNPLSSIQTSNSAMGSGVSAAQQGYAGQASTLNQQYANQLSAYNAQQAGTNSLMGGLGGLAGIALDGLIFSSDENVKTDKRPVRGVLDAVKNMRVESWRYKDGDPNAHVGTYAQDFTRETGLGDGKTISVIDALGVTMGAIKELAEKVDRK